MVFANFPISNLECCQRRTQIYNAANNDPAGGAGLKHYFERIQPDAAVFTHDATAEHNLDDVFNVCKAHCEESGRSFNYLPTEAELAAPAEKAASEEAEK